MYNGAHTKCILYTICILYTKCMRSRLKAKFVAIELQTSFHQIFPN